ncbi:hypothetical protein [Xenorhabdus griffiniae]|uniref:Uncharacterized protein n=1 Tax=Xenorhabdus griffiniae TaxID=351672 RepID=A0ABY9XJT8_9GAMM|nr:hypothetical protein [Xenorhabdus griffiniae]MBD1227595.1 hypothetical protein [Xenorhabdus griffiniae]WMV73161.1 hypothetical protein QL128_03720 [Xenorhabdus griffiniae]WNH02840.1 hypothetical protein QL112_003725 [Xenorhabdus griffiniae]
MNNKIFSKGWFKALILSFFKDLLWTNIPVVVIFIWVSVCLYFFPDVWGWFSLFGIIIILALFFIFAYISEKNKS